jgi:signal transduction histidine kinase
MKNIFKTKPSLTIRFIIGIAVIMTISLLIFYLLMQPPLKELGLMALFLSFTAVISIIVGYIAYKQGWIERSPTIHWTLLGGYALASILTFFNVWVTARLMFADQHDLLLATILLVFAAGIAIVLGYFQSSVLTDRITQLDEAAQSISDGNLDVRIPVSGRDEMAILAKTFNKMAEQLQEASRKQEEAENLRRDLIAWVGHDLQTPLASIQAIVEALADGIIEDPETVNRYLNTAKKDIQDLSILIDDLFQLAQLDAGGLQLNVEYNNLSDLISDTLESFSAIAHRQDVTIKGSVESDVDPVFMDAQRIGRVLNNLINNAILHTPNGGQVSVNAECDKNIIVVHVHDTGEGINPDVLPYVFDRFYRGEKSRNRTTGGAGLGLAIAKGIVEAHGGTITVRSEIGKETCFTFSLPKNSQDHIHENKQ